MEVAPKIYDTFLNPETGATKLDFAALKDVPDEEVVASVLQKTGDSKAAELAVKAKHGDEEARKEYVDKSYYGKTKKSQ